MPDFGKIITITAAGIGAFALLLLIISVGTVTWLDDGNGNSIGLFRKCFGGNVTVGTDTYAAGCYNENRVTQGGLSVFGLLLLAFGVIAVIANIFLKNRIVLFASLGLFYFASMFVMAAYATWGSYSRDQNSYFFPIYGRTDNYTSMGASYNLCVASHYFLWTALTLLAFGAGYVFGTERNTATT